MGAAAPEFRCMQQLGQIRSVRLVCIMVDTICTRGSGISKGVCRAWGFGFWHLEWGLLYFPISGNFSQSEGPCWEHPFSGNTPIKKDRTPISAELLFFKKNMDFFGSR